MDFNSPKFFCQTSCSPYSPKFFTTMFFTVRYNIPAIISTLHLQLCCLNIICYLTSWTIRKYFKVLIKMLALYQLTLNHINHTRSTMKIVLLTYINLSYTLWHLLYKLFYIILYIHIYIYIYLGMVCMYKR